MKNSIQRPVKIGFGELYAALDRGTIDATINYTPVVKSYEHYEFAKHLTETNMGQVLGYGGGINPKLFKKKRRRTSGTFWSPPVTSTWTSIA